MAIREKRAVKRSLFTPGSKKFWNLKTEHARLLFIVVLTNSDDEGRLEGDPEDIKALIPRSNWPLEDITTYIRDLNKVELVDYYRVKGHWYIQVVDFWEHQERHGVSQEVSSLPCPPIKRSEVIQEHQDGVPELPVRSDLSLAAAIPLVSAARKEESEEGTKGQWSNFARKYKHLIGKKPQDHKKNRELYDKACMKYGEGRVLAALERCLPDQTESYLAKPVFAWSFLTSVVDDFIEEPERGTHRGHKTKAEEREENNAKVLERVLGRS